MMKLFLRFAAVLGVVLTLTPHGSPQVRRGAPPTAEEEQPLPNGKKQQDEILKADHQKDLKDAAQLVDLSEQLKAELEKNDQNVLSISSIKKTEEIEKLAKRIRSRMRR